MLRGPALIAYLGGMAGKKTAHLVMEADRLSYAKVPYKTFSPSNSARPTVEGERQAIVSRFCDLSLDAIPINAKNPEEMLRMLERKTRVVIIDEAHMFDASALEETLEELLDRRLVLNIAGLTSDYGGVMFPVMRFIVSRAEEIKQCFGFCTETGCENAGIMTQAYRGQKLLSYNKDENIIAGDVKGSSEEVVYKPKCIEHFVYPPGSPRYQEKKK